MSQLEQRKKIKIFIDAGITSAKEISAKTGISLRTIFRIKSILREGKSITHKSVSGRPKAITYSHKKSIIRSLNSHSKISIRSVHANLSSKYTDAPSTSTVYRSTRACGFNFKQPVMGPFITPLIAKNRVEWCKDHVNYC
ncbi:Transposable element Tc1 transposase [Oopsacas minuta]|uniref:Transposable element Tc1 transposase n=1 Tax=Oopsacas minuta TaxID=111878 RepID=A0AAV7JEI9_9METZ|nr:Transposable element Tc1 transposase [Oopsacas minuta]